MSYASAAKFQDEIFRLDNGGRKLCNRDAVIATSLHGGGSHRNIKPGHVYVALSRARHSNCVVMDRNPLSEMITGEGNPASGYIVDALKNSRALLVY